MPEYILKEDAVAAIDQTLVLEGKYHAIEAIQALPPVSVEGEYEELVRRLLATQRKSGKIKREAAQAITVLQGRVEAVREECAKVAENAPEDMEPTSAMPTGFIVASNYIAKAIRTMK